MYEIEVPVSYIKQIKKTHSKQQQNMAHEESRSSFIIIINLDRAVHFG